MIIAISTTNLAMAMVGVEIVWDNVDSMGGCILGRVSGIPADFFAGADRRHHKGDRAWDGDHRTHCPYQFDYP